MESTTSSQHVGEYAELVDDDEDPPAHNIPAPLPAPPPPLPPVILSVLVVHLTGSIYD